MWRQNIIFLVAAFLTTTYGNSVYNRGLPPQLRELENVHYDGGVPWMLIPDDEGVLHIAILTEISPPETKNPNIHLELYTRSNPTTPYRLLVNDVDNLNNSPFNPKNPTKILIHGFGGNGQTALIINCRNAYLARGDYNIIAVDWGVLASSPNYPGAALNTRVAGAHVAQLIDFLVAQRVARLKNIHLIGFSLGAHVVGFAGKSVTSGKVGRITGLDPAGPLFDIVGPSGRLDAGDAKLVDVIYTSSGLLALTECVGHVCFYPNRGSRPQPGCGILDLAGTCAHGRAVDFFVFSIRNPDAFPAVECLTVNQALNGACTGTGRAFMGDDIRFDWHGIYFLNTGNVPGRQLSS